MKYLSLGLEYDTGNWVYPKYIRISNDKSNYVILGGTIGKKIENKNLKITVDVVNNSCYSYSRGGDINTYSTGIGLVVGKKTYRFDIITRNLLRILSTHGLDDGKILNGTYKLIGHEGSGSFCLIPENTAEDIIKTEISGVYYDATKQFSKNMIPGHLYVTKNKSLMLCVATNLDFWSKNLRCGSYYDFYWRLVNYSETPKKVKILIKITNSTVLDILGPGTNSIQEIIGKTNILKLQNCIYSERYAGKDLGPYIPDNGRTFEESLLGIKTHYDYYFIDNLFLNDPTKKIELIHNLKNNERCKLIKTRNQELEKLEKKLGL